MSPSVSQSRFPKTVRIIYLAGFAIIGLWAHSALNGFFTRQHSSPMGASETFVGMALGASAAGPELVRRLGEAPAQRDVLLFTPVLDETSVMLIQNVAYLVWPRRVVSAVLSGSGREAIFLKTMASCHPGAILFYRLSVPASVKNREAIGPKLTFVPVP